MEDLTSYENWLLFTQKQLQAIYIYEIANSESESGQEKPRFLAFLHVTFKTLWNFRFGL